MRGDAVRAPRSACLGAGKAVEVGNWEEVSIVGRRKEKEKAGRSKYIDSEGLTSE